MSAQGRSDTDALFGLNPGDDKIISLNLYGSRRNYSIKSAEVYSVSDKSAATASSMMQSGTLARVIGGETLIPEVLYEGMPVSGNYAVDFDMIEIGRASCRERV